jgi:hypothetical protein
MHPIRAKTMGRAPRAKFNPQTSTRTRSQTVPGQVKIRQRIIINLLKTFDSKSSWRLFVNVGGKHHGYEMQCSIQVRFPNFCEIKASQP